MNRWIEDEIRRNPAQYLWVHKRFKTRPAGEPSLVLMARAIIRAMKLRFTKMHGAGNDFVVLDATREPIDARRAEQMRRLGDRRFGVGADQILVVETQHDAGRRLPLPHLQRRSGDEVEQCGNGARCFVRYVHDKGLTDKTTHPRRDDEHAARAAACSPTAASRSTWARRSSSSPRVPFDADGLEPARVDGFELWPLDVDGAQVEVGGAVDGQPARGAARRRRRRARRSRRIGPLIETPSALSAQGQRRLHAGGVARAASALRVYERGAGETLACGTGACAAVVAGIRLGWLDSQVDVETRGGRAHDRVGRRAGRRARADDRAGADRLRRRDRTVSTAAIQGITETRHRQLPGQHARLLRAPCRAAGASIQLTSPHGQRAVSLQERQMEMLRDKIKGLEHKIIEMIRNGQENVAIADRLHRWTRALMLTAEPGRPARRAGRAS